jgi:acid ceramidase
MTPPILDVDLSAPARERWQGLRAHRDAIRELIPMYVRDLGGIDTFRDALALYRTAYVSAEHAAEVDAVAELAGVDPVEMLLVNVYYDAFKHVLGCTAFALDTPEGPLHARNLDWWTDNNVLAKHTLITRFHRAGERVFDAVTWPGFLGVLSGCAPGRFSVTLNAVISDEAPGIATPVGFVLRDLLATASYEQAVAELSKRPLVCDCLLLVCGTRDGEMCVIERTPTHAAVRRSDSGAIVVTNDYRELTAAGWTRANTGTLQATSCGRYDRASWRVHAERPANADQCYAILDDERVRMEITVQQMVMSARAGWLSAKGAR